MKKTARIAGIVYFFLAVTGMLGILYIPSQIIVTSDAAATAQNVIAHETLFRLGIVFQLACQTLFVYLVLLLYRLFRGVDKNYALQMVSLVIVSVPIAFLNLVNQFSLLLFVTDPNTNSAFSHDQVNALGLLSFRLYGYGTLIAQIFWGLWLIPFGVLVFKSGFIPKLLGILLILGGVGYVIASLEGLLFPELNGMIGSITSIPAGLGEFAMIFWLIIKGVRDTHASAEPMQ